MGWLILSFFIWERFSVPCEYVYITVAFIELVLLGSSSHPFKIDIITFTFQVGRKFSDLQVEPPAVTTMWCATVHFSSSQTPCLSAQTSYLEAFPPGCAKTLWLFCCYSCFIGPRGEDHHHSFYEWWTLFINGLVRRMLKTAKLLSRRPYHTWL